jgi:pimeloyl-ACP methyl ester carboxylesterase
VRAPAPTTIAGAEVRVGADVIRYRTAGSGSPLVLLHGLGGSTRYWEPVLPALAARYRVYLVDLPGFGAMRHLHRRFAVTHAAGWLRDWMAAAGLPRAHLVAHSMGGYIAVRLAVETPEALDRLVLVAPAGLPTGRSLLRHVCEIPRMLRHGAARRLPLFGLDALRVSPRLVWRTARDLLAEDVGAVLGAIRAPTLVLWGEDDTLVPVTLAATFRRAIPDARLVVLPAAGHLPMLDRPAAFSGAVLAFLDGEAIGE